MKDFKQNTKMMCEGGHYKKGGKVKRYENGGKVSFEDAATVAMSKDSSGRPTYGAKTPIGTVAAQKSYDENWMKKESRDDTFDRIIKARDEADDEASREANRGISPANRKKRGGKVKK